MAAGTLGVGSGEEGRRRGHGHGEEDDPGTDQTAVEVCVPELDHVPARKLAFPKILLFTTKFSN